jgi:hypothetical protein
MKHVVVAVIGSHGTVSTNFAAALSKTSELAKEKSISIQVDFVPELTSGMSTSLQKNIISNKVLSSKTADGVFFINPNLSWEAEDFFKLVNYEGEGIISGAFVDSFEAGESYAISLADYMDAEGEFSKAKFFSMGFVYVPKKVLQGLCQFVEVLGEEDDENKFYIFFKESIKDGLIFQEDNYFCDKVKTSGFELLVDSKVNCTNNSIMAIRTDYQAYLAKNWMATMDENTQNMPQ